MAKLLTGGVTHIVVGDVCPQTGLFPIRDVGDPIWAQTLSATFLHMGSILKLDGTIDVLDPRLRMPVLLTVDQLVAENEGQAWLKPPIMYVHWPDCRMSSELTWIGEYCKSRVHAGTQFVVRWLR